MLLLYLFDLSCYLFISFRQSVFEMKDVYGMFTMDTIASIAFGVNSDSLNNTQVWCLISIWIS